MDRNGDESDDEYPEREAARRYYPHDFDEYDDIENPLLFPVNEEVAGQPPGVIEPGPPPLILENPAPALLALNVEAHEDENFFDNLSVSEYESDPEEEINEMGAVGGIDEIEVGMQGLDTTDEVDPYAPEDYKWGSQWGPLSGFDDTGRMIDDIGQYVGYVCDYMPDNDRKQLQTRSQIHVLQRIGEGRFGHVFRAVKGYDMVKIAIKIIDIDYARNNKNVVITQRQILNEYNMARNVTQAGPHPSIINHYLEDFILSTDDGGSTFHRLYMPMELANCSLKRFTLLFFKKRIEVYAAQYIFKQVTKGVFYLHRRLHMAHNDIKMENMFIFYKEAQGFFHYQVKIGDFGSATIQDTYEQTIMNSEELMGTISPCAPECLLPEGTQYNPYKADVFSLGVMLYEMVSGHIAYSPEREMLKESPKVRQEFNEKWLIYDGWVRVMLQKQKSDKNYLNFLLQNIPVMIELRELIKNTMDPNPDLRLTIKEIRDHPFTRGEAHSDYASLGSALHDYTHQTQDLDPFQPYTRFGPRQESAQYKTRYRKPGPKFRARSLSL